MNDQEFAAFLKSISHYDNQDYILFHHMKFIKEFYLDFRNKVENEFDDRVLNEFKVDYGGNPNYSLVNVNVQNNPLSFKANFKENAIEITFNGHKKDKLVINDDEKFMSKEYNKELSRDLLESYLDIFKELKNN